MEDDMKGIRQRCWLWARRSQHPEDVTKLKRKIFPSYTVVVLPYEMPKDYSRWFYRGDPRRLDTTRGTVTARICKNQHTLSTALCKVVVPVDHAGRTAGTQFRKITHLVAAREQGDRIICCDVPHVTGIAHPAPQFLYLFFFAL